MAVQRHDAKVSAEGRVVIPAAVRDALGVRSGDRVQFVVEGSAVRIVTARSLLNAVWANNTGGDGGDSVADVRAARLADKETVEAKWDRIEADVVGLPSSEEEIEAALLNQLGLA